ncbi:MAG: oligosaccharide MFS transporter [Actinomycetaceae bacterium]|nr:oligosaccharide MFS transporter [Actinomycetaceae bacterium]
MRHSLANPAYRFGSSIIALGFISWALWWGFYQLWLTSDASGLALGGAEVGLVYAIHGLCSAAAMIVYGVVQDKLDLKRHLMICVALLMTLTGPFVSWVYRPALESNIILGAILGGVFLASAFTGMVGLVEAYVDRLSRRTGFEFGQARMWGSLGFACAMLGAGFIFTANPVAIFWAASLGGAMMLGLLLIWKVPVTHGVVHATTPSLRDIVRITRERKFWVFVAFVLLTWALYQIFETQLFPSYYTGLFDDDVTGQRLYGALIFMQAALESGLMASLPFVIYRVGVKNSMIASSLAMFIVVVGAGLSEHIVAVSVAKLVHAVLVPLMMVAVLKYIALHFAAELSATVFLAGFYVTNHIGAAMISPVLGAMRDRLGYQVVFLSMAIVMAVTAIWASRALCADNEPSATVVSALVRA